MTIGMKPGQRVLTTLRRMIATGELKTGERVAEIPTAAALGVSRMPVRTALRMLEQEGLVTRLGARGYAACCPSPERIGDAIELRGVLEGLAARRLAARGLDAATGDAFGELLASGDAIFAPGTLADGDFERYSTYNVAFHALLVGASDSRPIQMAIRRNDHLPFASADALALDVDDPAYEFAHLHAAHGQHHAIVRAIRLGDGALAETLTRDHAMAAMVARS